MDGNGVFEAKTTTISRFDNRTLHPVNVLDLLVFGNNIKNGISDIIDIKRRINNGVPLKSGLRVTQGHWKWRRSIDDIRLYISLPLCRCNYSYVTYHFRVFDVQNIVTWKSRLGVTEGRWKWHNSIDRVRVPIHVHCNYGRIVYGFQNKAR